MLTKENLNEALADAVLDLPREFLIGNERYCLWFPSLGQSILIGRCLAQLEIDWNLLKANPALAALQIAKKQREIVCQIVAILAFRGKENFDDSRIVKRRAEFYVEHIDDEDLASLLLIVLNEPKAEDYIALTGLKEEQEEQARIAALKNKDGHTLSFGGKTIYGILIDAACRAYGWSKEYAVWGIDLVSLRMKLADTVNSVYLSDKEAEELAIGKYSPEVYGMGADDFEKLKNMDWD